MTARSEFLRRLRRAARPTRCGSRAATLRPIRIAIHDGRRVVSLDSSVRCSAHSMGSTPAWAGCLPSRAGCRRSVAGPSLARSPPITLGHALAIAAALLVAGLVEMLVPLTYLNFAIGFVLIGYGLYRLYRSRHFGWSRMQVGFAQLTLWSFLMATAQGPD